MDALAIKALGQGLRFPRWRDSRPQSPKAQNDFSGIILPRVTAPTGMAMQDLDYDLLSRIYVCHDLAWTCINLVSSTAALGKLVVKKKVGDKVTILPDHPLQLLLDSPNSSMTQFDLIQSYITHQLLFGTVGMMLLRDSMTGQCPDCSANGETQCLHQLYYFTNGKVKQIVPVHPGNVQEKSFLMEDGKTQKYFAYIPFSDAETRPINPDNFMTDPFYNTDVSFYGVSPTQILRRWLNLDMSMTGQITSFFDNGAIPSMIFNLKPAVDGSAYGDEPETLLKNLKDSWLNTFSRKGNGEKTPAFIYGDVEIKRLQEHIDEQISKNIYYEVANRVCATYGVPPDLYEFGLHFGAQASSAEEHTKRFFNNTINVYLTRIQRKINRMIVPSFNEKGLFVDWDLSNMGVADFLIKAKNEAHKDNWVKGLTTRDETRIALGMPGTDDELGDDYYRLTVMTDGSNTSQNPQDNRLATPEQGTSTNEFKPKN